MFENYQKQSEEDSRYGRIALYAVIASFIYVAVIILVSGALEPDSPQTQTISPDDKETAQNAETLCASLPMPERLEFTGKSEPKNDYESHLVIYRYRSPRSPEEIMPAFLFWLNENGWQRVPNTESTFRKSSFSIYLRHESTDFMTNYEIYCSEKISPRAKSINLINGSKFAFINFFIISF